jgi:hypothetical protein
MAEIVAKRLVEHLQRSGFVVMKRPPEMAPRRSRSSDSMRMVPAQSDMLQPEIRRGEACISISVTF